MPHIALPEELPGITAGFAFRPDTAKPMRELAHILLYTSGNDGFSSRDRELVAAFVSFRNTCYFCQTSHGAAATYLNGEIRIWWMPPAGTTWPRQSLQS